MRNYDSTSRSLRAEALRHRVLEAARKLFIEQGIDRVTVAEIALAADAGTSTVYAAFESKAGILRALMKSVLFGSRYQSAIAVTSSSSDPVTRLLSTAAKARAIYQSEHEALGLLRDSSAFSPELRALDEEFENLRYEMQKERVEDLSKAGLLAANLTKEDARRILWALSGRDVFHSLVTKGGWPPERYETWLAELIHAQLVLPGVSGTPKEKPMTKNRILPPPNPAKGEKLKGPASYFSSIEKTYGQPIQHWLDLCVTLLETNSHMEAVNVLKNTHGLGHGHANAVVAYVKAALPK